MPEPTHTPSGVHLPLSLFNAMAACYYGTGPRHPSSPAAELPPGEALYKNGEILKQGPRLPDPAPPSPQDERGQSPLHVRTGPRMIPRGINAPKPVGPTLFDPPPSKP